VAKTAKRKTYHHGDLRNALIAAALEALAEHGVEGFTLRDVARRARVSSAAPYRHFSSRDELLAAVAADCAERLGAAMDEAARTAPPDDTVAVFRASGIAYVRFAVSHPAHFRVMNIPAVTAQMPAAVRGEVEAWMTTASAALARAQAAGAVSDQPVNLIMLAAHCLVHGLAHMIVDGHDGFAALTPDQAAALAEEITGVLGVGLLPRGPADG